MKKIGNIVRYTAEEIDELRKNGGSKKRTGAKAMR